MDTQRPAAVVAAEDRFLVVENGSTELLAKWTTEHGQTLLRHIAELEAEVKRLRMPQWFYGIDDPEYTYGDLDEAVQYMDPTGVMQVAGAREVYKTWVARRVLTVDENGEAEETEAAEFATEPEAAASWETSLAAARDEQRASQIRQGVG